MEFTGERYVPDKFGKLDDISQMHLGRYEFSLSFIKNLSVVDIACGEGYGSNMISEFAKDVTGIDIEYGVIKYAQKKYARDNLSFEVGSVEKIRKPDSSIDAVISFETIEHVNRKTQILFLKEVNRVLRPGGIFIVSTPDKDIGGEGHNEFHVCEMNKNKYFNLLSNYFNSVNLYGQDIKRYKNSFFLFLIRFLHKLVKLDKYKLRHKIFSKKFRFGIDNSVSSAALNQDSISDDRFVPLRLKNNETARFLVAVCEK